MSTKERSAKITSVETASAAKMIIVPSSNQSLRVGNTIQVISTPTLGQNFSPGQAMIAIKPMSIVNQSEFPVTSQSAASPKKMASKSSTIKPPSGSGTITILSRMPSATETTGAIKMISNAERVRILPHHLPVSLPVSLPGTLTTTMEPVPKTFDLPILPHDSQISISKNSTQIILSEECPIPEMLAPQPVVTSKVYTYRSGKQYPLNLKRPRKGTALDIVLSTHPMIEILSTEIKEKGNHYSAVCHSCRKEFFRITANKLSEHVASSVHDRRLNLPNDLTESEIKEKARRQLLLTNKKFVSFLEVREDDSLWCKWCNFRLQWSNDKITSHRHTIKHINNADREREDTQFTEKEKLEKLHKLVDMYPDFLGLVNKFDKKMNDEYFEHYKAPSQITLKINDLYCKPCKRKLNRADFTSYHDAVVKHFKSKHHKEQIEQQQAKFESALRSRAVRAPPVKICTRVHDPIDLKETARLFAECSLPFSQSGASLSNVVKGAICRSASSFSMSAGVRLLNDDFLADMSALANKHIYIVADEAHIGTAGSLVNITIGALEECSIPPFASVATTKRAMTGVLLAEEIMYALRRIWTTEEEVVKHQHHVVSMTTDGASYNEKAARILKEKGLKTLLHVLCLVHGVSLVCNTIVDNHKTLKTFASNVQSTFNKSVVQQVVYDKSSNIFIQETLKDHLLNSNTDFKSEQKGDMSIVSCLSPPEDLKSTKMWQKMTDHAKQIEADGGAEMFSETKDKVWKKAARTRFSTQLAQLNYCHSNFTKIANYVSTLKVAPVKKSEDKEEEDKKKRKTAKVKFARDQLSNCDEVENGLEYLHSFNPLQDFLSKLESRKMVVSEAAVVVNDIRQCLQEAQSHPQEEKYRTAEKALTKFEQVIAKRFLPLAEKAKVNPLYERVPFSSIKVESDFSVVKHCLGNRKNYKPDNLGPNLQVVLHQKAVAAGEREQKKRAVSQDTTKRRKRVKGALHNALQDHTYCAVTSK